MNTTFVNTTDCPANLFPIGDFSTSIVQFLRDLKAYRRVLPRQVLMTLRGQALAGDVDSAVRGLTHFLKKDLRAVPPSA